MIDKDRQAQRAAFTAARGREEKKRRAEAVARRALDERRAAEELAGVTSQVREILADLDDVVVERVGELWKIRAMYRGRPHGGARSDAISLAHDMRAAAIAERETVAAAAVVEPPPPPPPPAEPPPAVVVHIDPLDPAHWSSIEGARAALIVLVTRAAAARTGFGVTLYERMVELDARKASGRATRDEELELMQHESWSQLREGVEAARRAHIDRINALQSVEAARAYHPRVDQDWPET